MKDFIVKDKGINWAYKNKEKAVLKAQELGKKVECDEYWYYMGIPHGNSEKCILRGENFIKAIESNIIDIVKNTDTAVRPGYSLENVSIKRMDGSVYLVIEYYNHGKLNEKRDFVSRKVKIEGVENEDFEAQEYKIKIIKRSN